MPLNVRRFSSSIFLVLFISATFTLAQSQQVVNQPSPIPANSSPIKTPTAGEIMRERISKAKAFIAVRNYNAAIYELEMIRRESSDPSVLSVVNILLMNSYLEQGNYKKAQDFLGEFYKQFKSGNANAATHYSAVAAQVVKGARNQIDRYRALGLSVSDRTLPLEAVNDIEKMREMLETVIAQTRETSSDKARAAVSMPLLEEAIAARSGLARDDYDARRWRDEGDDAREQVASSRSVVINATDGMAVPQNTTPLNTSTNLAGSSPMQPVVNRPSDTQSAVNSKTVDAPITTPVQQQAMYDRPVKTEDAIFKQADAEKQLQPQIKPSGPIEVGSLLEYATAKTAPTYPTAARTMRATGVVKVEVVVDENGDVAEVRKANGHQLLVAAAKDAIVKWKFRPVLRDGQAVRASGYVNFNFTL